MPAENKPADPFGPNGRTFHIHLSVRGALRDFSKRELKGMFAKNDGSKLTAAQAREYLADCIAKGIEVLPLSAQCVGFDFAGTGCPGHDNPPPAVSAHDLVPKEAV